MKQKISLSRLPPPTLRDAAMATFALGLDFTDEIDSAERAIVLLTGGLLCSERAVGRLSLLLDRLPAKRIIYCYDETLGWNFSMIYGSPEPGTPKAALKARDSIVSHECITHRPRGNDGEQDMFQRYEHEAMALRMLSLM